MEREIPKIKLTEEDKKYLKMMELGNFLMAYNLGFAAYDKMTDIAAKIEDFEGLLGALGNGPGGLIVGGIKNIKWRKH